MAIANNGGKSRPVIPLLTGRVGARKAEDDEGAN
jgi:hypothetical protein